MLMKNKTENKEMIFPLLLSIKEKYVFQF